MLLVIFVDVFLKKKLLTHIIGVAIFSIGMKKGSTAIRSHLLGSSFVLQCLPFTWYGHNNTIQNKLQSRNRCF
jgi:hypothetical protein